VKLTKGTVLTERYEIIEHIGSGGMALVYKAKDLKLERIVAIKTLREEYITDMEFLKRFSSEARAAASLSNANIVNAYDVGTEGDVYFIVMEYVDGVTLKELIKKRAPFGSEEVLSVAIQIADALSHAHKNGIIHRDIKPQNIIVTKDGVVKVTDFGIARNADAETTTSSGAMGSVHYFSPEQARGKFVDFRSDIYSLGIVMFEMATGSLPFDGDTAVTVALKHISEPLPDVRDINPNISMSAFKILRKAAAKSLAQRYDSAESMLKDLKKAMIDDSGRFVKEPIELIGTRKMDTQELERINDFSEEALNEFDEYEEDFDDEEYEDDEDFDYEEEYAADKRTDLDYENELDKQSERKIIIAAIITGVAIIILVTAIGLWLYRGRDANEEYVPPYSTEAETMPTLGGMDIDEARAVLEEIGLVVGTVEEVYSDDIPAGIIARYYPEQGTEVEYGDEVNITISRGSGRILIPNVTGYLFNNVVLMQEFADNIFVYEEIQVFDDDIPIGVVVSQEPAAGAYATRGQTIRLEVSMGREIRNVIVPLIIGATEEVAKLRLEEAGLRIGQIAAAYHAEFPTGQVSMQNFAGGVEVTEGTVITFVVSLGPRPGTEPNEPDTGTQPPPNETQPQPPDEPPRIPDRTETVTIAAPTEALSLGPIQVRVDKVTNGVVENVFEQAGLLMGNFPLSVNVTGAGSFEVKVYVNGQMLSSQMFD